MDDKVNGQITDAITQTNVKVLGGGNHLLRPYRWFIKPWPIP